MGNRNWTFNASDGGQVNFAKGNATVYATQNNGVSGNEPDNIIKEVMDNLSRLNEKDADSLKDAIDMAKEELIKPEPKAGRLKI